jgi:hypothetical protein
MVGKEKEMAFLNVLFFVLIQRPSSRRAQK